MGEKSLPSLSIDLVLDDLDLHLTGDFRLDLDLDLEGLSLALLDLGDLLSSSLEMLDPDPLDELLGLGLELGLLLPFLFPDPLFLPLSPPWSLNFAIADPSGESRGGFLDLVLSLVLGELSRLDWEALRLALVDWTELSRGVASSFFSSSFQTSRARRSKISMPGASQRGTFFIQAFSIAHKNNKILKSFSGSFALSSPSGLVLDFSWCPFNISMARSPALLRFDLPKVHLVSGPCFVLLFVVFFHNMSHPLCGGSA